MQHNHKPLPPDYGAHVSTTARVGGMEGINTPPTIEGFDSGDGYVTVVVKQLGTSATMCFPMDWWEQIILVAREAELYAEATS